MILFLDSERRLRLPFRLLLYLLAWFTAVISLQAITDAVPVHQHLQRLVYLVLAVPAVLGVTVLFRRRLDRRPWAAIGLPRPGVIRLVRLALGCIAAYAVIGSITLTEWSLGWLDFTGAGVFWLFLTGFAGALTVTGPAFSGQLFGGLFHAAS